MITHADLRRDLRPHGVIAPGCYECPFFPDCGGVESVRSLFTCFDNTCCGDGSCDNVCPRKPDFCERLREVRGLRFDDVPVLTQVKMRLPRYIPLIHHGYRRTRPLKWPIVALETYELFRLVDGKYRTVADSPEELRARFVLDPATKIVLRGTAWDGPLERYWKYRRRDRAAEQLTRLDIALAVGPNFSHFLDVPRTDNLFNRKRQLICLEEMHEAGLLTVPHLSAVAPGDWDFWSRYLARNTQVNMVAVEFQTGNKKPSEGRKVIDRLAQLQDESGRRLHPIIIGGSQFLTAVSERFKSHTLLDSVPFVKAVHRQMFDRAAGRQHWTPEWTLPGFGIDEHVAKNIKGYSTWINGRTRRSAQTHRKAS